MLRRLVCWLMGHYLIADFQRLSDAQHLPARCKRCGHREMLLIRDIIT